MVRPADSVKIPNHPPTEVGGWFRSGLQRWAAESTNPTNGSWWIVQIQPPKQSGPSAFKSKFSFMALHCGRRLDLNHPPTPVGGIWSNIEIFNQTFCSTIDTSSVASVITQGL